MAMTRSLADLTAEVEKNGLTVPAGKAHKSTLQTMLRDFYWKRDSRGKSMPEQYEVMLAQNIKAVVEKDEERGTNYAKHIWKATGEIDNWVAQLKLDGCRLLMEVGVKSHRFVSRNISVQDFLFAEKTSNLPWHNELDMPGLEGTVLDGEVLAPYAVIDTGKFAGVRKSKGTVTASALQAVTAVINSGPELGIAIQKHYGPVEYHVFDILYFKGKDVRNQMYSERLKLLEQVFAAMPAKSKKHIINVPLVRKNKKEFYERMVKEGNEGIMLKYLRAPYEGCGPSGTRRSTFLLKAKRFEDVDAFVVGFIPGKRGKGWENLVGGLVFAVIDEKTGKSHIMGCVGSMTMEFRESITKKVKPYKVAENEEEVLYDGKIYYPSTSPGKNRTIDYELDKDILGRVAVIRGQEFTKNLRLKHCVCPEAYTNEGKWWPWRTDKLEKQCTFDVEGLRKKIVVGTRV